MSAGVMAAVVMAAALALIYWVWFCYRDASWPKTWVKTGSVAFLVLAAWLAGAAAALWAALLLCALGDYLLSRPSERAFMAGVGAFGAGHIAYVVLFLTHPMAAPGRIADMPQALVVGALAALGAIMARILWQRAGGMRGPVMAYIPVILSMGLAALALTRAGPVALALPAAALFIGSDFALALEKFVLRANHPVRPVLPFLVWPTYWGAQALFVMAFIG